MFPSYLFFFFFLFRLLFCPCISVPLLPVSVMYLKIPPDDDDDNAAGFGSAGGDVV